MMSDSPQRTNWLAIIILFCAGLAGAMQFAKLSPIMQLVATAMAYSPVAAGLTVSILGLVGVVFAVSVGTVANALGLARSLRAALFFGAAAALAGAFAPGPASFLVIRFLEGLSHLFIVVCAPALMAAAATPRDRPLALSLWGCFFGAGYAITSVVAPFLVLDGAWRNLLLAHAAVMGAVALAVTAVTRNDPAAGAWPGLAAIAARHLAVFRSGAPLLLALTFFAYTIQFLAVLTFLNIFLAEVKGWDPAQIGFGLFVAPLVSLVFTLASGFLVRAGVGIAAGFAASFVLLALSMTVTFAIETSDPWLITALGLAMACFGLLPGLAFANMPRAAPTPEQVTLGFSAIALFGNLGTFLGTPLLALVKGFGGWPAVAATLALISAGGVALALALAWAIQKHESQGT